MKINTHILTMINYKFIERYTRSSLSINIEMKGCFGIVQSLFFIKKKHK